MGKRIKKTITGLSFRMKISLILTFTLLFSVFMYQGWYRPFSIQATVDTPANGTNWTCPTGVYAVKVECWGGGGGGGGTTDNGGAGGGGGGGYSSSIVNVTPGNSYAIAVGAAGGAGAGNNSTGGAGGTSSFGGTTVVANGGSGGTGGASGARGNGAAAGTGNIAAFTGGNGAAGTASASGGGGGGAGTNGNGGSATGATAGTGTATGGGTGGAGRTTDTAGLAGSPSGGGGSGGFDAGGAASGGGAGAAGLVKITYISITGISPNSMNQGTGPTTITINGTEFASGATVTFSGTGVTAGASTFVSSTQITVPVTVAAGATVGARDITVTNPSPATMSTTGAGLFTVNAPATTTLGTGVNATTTTVGPGTTQKLGGLSFATNTGTDSVTALTVTTTGQAAIASMQIWNEASTQQYFGTVTNPGSNTWTFSGGTPIPVTATTQNYKIVVTYDNHATAPVADTATTGYVTAYTCANAKAGTDSAEATLTLDNTASTAATWGSNSGGASVTLNWTNGSGGNIMIARYTANTDTTMPTDGNTYIVSNPYGTGGTVVYVGTGTTTTDSPVSSGTYYYKAFAYDGFQNYATTAPWSAGLAVDNTLPSVSTTVPTNSATGIAPNSNVTINWTENVNCSTVNTANITMSSGGWALSTCSGNQAVFTTSGQANSTSYTVTVGTGVKDTIGNAMAAAYPFSYTTAAAAGINGTTCGTATAAQASPTSILVTMPYSDDANGNNTYLVEYKEGAGSFVVWPPNPQSHAASPFTTTITGLTSGLSYTVRVTYQDGNGIVGGTATQTLGPITLAAWTDSPLLHNSNRFAGTTKWGGSWGTPSGQYGAFACETCHYETGNNIKDIREAITAPSGSFPGQTGGSSINFQSRTSPNGFGDDLRVPNTSSTFVCEYCHSQTSVHRYNASGQTDFNHKSANNTNCLSCHPHNTGFKASCATCHGFPPVSVATLASPVTSALPGGQAGAHAIHATTRGFACDACHNAYTTNPMGNQKIEIGFALNNANVPGFQGTVTTGTFTGNLNANLTNSYTWQSNSAGTTINQAAATTTCSVWCHGNWTGANGTASTASWVGGTSQAACGACHGKDAASVPTAGSHARHAGAGAGQTALMCSDCHGADPTNNDHVNGNVLWSLNTASSKFGAAATYKGSATQSSAVPSTYGSCSVYCHSSVQNATGSAVASPTATPAWGTAAPLNCDTSNCHGNPPAGGGSHDQHNVAGYAFTCATCHSAAGDETTKHADYKIDVAFSGLGAGGTYTQSATNPPGNGFGNCGSSYCHSDGKATPVSYATPTWGTAATGNCGTCHRVQDTNANMAAAGSPSAMTAAHYKHLATDRYGLNAAYNCGACHAETASNNTTLLVSGGKHVNNARDWKFGTFGGLDQSGGTFTTSCTSTYCHSKGRATTAPFTAPVSNILWSAGAGSSSCTATCHGGNDTAANVTTNGPFDSHVDHISTAEYNLTCAECHAETVAAGTSTTLNASTGYTKHVNGAKDWKFGATLRGNAAISQATGTYTTGTCANIYCHSKGTIMSNAPTGTTYTGNHAPYQQATWTGTFNCNGCHGDATYTNGMPSYANGTPKANSHSAHTSYSCDKCHYLVTTTGTSIAATGFAHHIDGNYDVSNSAGNITYAMGTITSGVPAGGSCSGAGVATGCHGGSGPFTWGETLTCSSCHARTTAQGGDLDVWTTGSAAMIDSDEWVARGHGLPSASSYPDPSGTANSGAGFVEKAGGGQDACLWCHDKTPEHLISSANPFRLRNYNALGNGWNDACLYCHDTNQTTAGYKAVAGFTTGINLSLVKKVDKWHYGSQHSTTLNGGQLCWDCHDPHGDSSNQIKMVQRLPIRASANNASGVPIPSSVSATAVVFTANNAATGAGAFAMTSGTFAQGICNNCHTYKAADPNKMVHYTNSASDSHNSGTLCTSCHKHSGDTNNGTNAFAANEDDCKSCHSTAGGTRPVEGEFGSNSHHINKTWANMTNFDCVVCHAEAQIVTGAVKANSTYHHAPAGTVDLYDGGNRSTVYSVNLSFLTLASGTAADKNTANSSLDTFCMSCHRVGGAAAITTGNGFPAGYSATNPFGEATGSERKNAYDQVAKSFTAGGGGLAVYDDFDTTRNSHHAVRGARYTASTGLTFGVSLKDAGLLSNAVVMSSGTTGVADNSTLHCNDCHSTAASSHGGANEYMLQTATAVSPTGEHTITTYVCYKCHPSGSYSTATGHTGNDQDYVDTAAGTGAARNSGNGNYMGIACLNCHDGAVGWGGAHGVPNATYTDGAGGTQTKRRFLPGASLAKYRPSSASATIPTGWASRGAYVMGGFLKPNTYYYVATTTGKSASTAPSWPTTVGATVTDGAVTWKNVGTTAPADPQWVQADGGCYTLSSAGSWGSCTQHGGNAQDKTKTNYRPVNY